MATETSIESAPRPRALVTGASSGIGRAIALELARDGAEVLLVGRSESRLLEVQKRILGSGGRSLAFAVDLSRQAELEKLTARIRGECDQLEVLVHCAGTIHLGSIEESDPGQLERQFQLNVLVPYQLTRDLLPLVEKGAGQVIFINSSILFHPRPGTLQFAVTQHALKGLADGLRAEVNGRGIRVLSVYPGRTATPRMEQIVAGEGREYRPETLLQPEDVARVVSDATRLPPRAEVVDLHVRPRLKS